MSDSERALAQTLRSQRKYGKYRAFVVDNADPDLRGRDQGAGAGAARRSGNRLGATLRSLRRTRRPGLVLRAGDRRPGVGRIRGRRPLVPDLERHLLAGRGRPAGGSHRAAPVARLQDRRRPLPLVRRQRGCRTGASAARRRRQPRHRRRGDGRARRSERRPSDARRCRRRSGARRRQRQPPD
jgi:hypothetical protein